MKESDYLHAGDPVWWKGAWGTQEAKMAEVEGIQKDVDNFTKRGTPVDKLPWSVVKRYHTVTCKCGSEMEASLVDLTNGHWAYGWQIRPVEMWRRTYDE